MQLSSGQDKESKCEMFYRNTTDCNRSIHQGQGIYAFVILREGFAPSDQLKKEMWTNVRTAIGAFAAPDVIHWVSGLFRVTMFLLFCLLCACPCAVAPLVYK